MSDDYKVQNAYEGGECQVKYAVPASTKLEFPKSNHNITFTNAEGYEVGTMDFNGPGLSFEGVADESAIVFMDWVANIFKQRLQDEYDKGFKDGKAAK
jgi:predicted alpha/beta hydrolase